MVTFYQWCKHIIEQPGNENMDKVSLPRTVFYFEVWPVYFPELTIDNLMMKLNKSYHKISYIILFLYSVYSFTSIFKSTCGKCEDTTSNTLMQHWNVLFMNLSNHGFLSQNFKFEKCFVLSWVHRAVFLRAITCNTCYSSWVYVRLIFYWHYG